MRKETYLPLGFIALVLVIGIVLTACGSDRTDVDRPNGDECSDDMDCSSGLCLEELGTDVEFPDGLCTNECDAWGNDSGCEEHEICLRHTQTNMHHCYQRCENEDGEPTECRDGFECYCLGLFNCAYTCLPAGLD